MDYQKILGENIHSLRIKQQLTQEQLAELCDLHRTYIGAMERGDRKVTPSELLKYDSKIQLKKED